MPFSPEQALNHARTIAYPRRVGSDGEQAVLVEITNFLTGLGYHVEQQPFQFIGSLHRWIRLELACGSLLILAILTLRTTSPRTSILPAILLLSLILLVNPLQRWVQSSSFLGDLSTTPARVRILSWLGLKCKSTNIVASTPDLLQQDAHPYLYLVAHYDSKSQTLPLPIRIALFVLYILGGFSVSILTILSLLFPQLDTFIPYFAWASLIFGIPLFFMRVGNDSPGAIDNASGVGLLLQLAEHMAEKNDLLQKLHVTFLFTAAEEEGLMGAQAYVVENEAKMQQLAQSGGVYILNFDGIGAQGNLLLAEPFRGLQKAPEVSLGGWIREICSELGYSLGRFPPIGALMDHAPFAHHGFDAISLATAGKAAWSVHTAHDTIEKLHPRGFERAGRVALRLIEMLAQ